MNAGSRLTLSRRALGSAGALSLTWLLGCGPASGGDPQFWAPVLSDGGGAGQSGAGQGGGPGSGGSGTMAGGSAGAPATSSGTGALPGIPEALISFTTVSFNGEYAPENVGAVWVLDAAGSFVKTLEIWGTKRIKYVTRWKAASGGSTVDAVTGATRSSHGPHKIEWDLTGVDGALVPDGKYQVLIEFTEKNGAGAWTTIALEKSASPFTAAPPDTAYFIDQQLTFSPGE